MKFIKHFLLKKKKKKSLFKTLYRVRGPSQVKSSTILCNTLQVQGQSSLIIIISIHPLNQFSLRMLSICSYASVAFAPWVCVCFCVFFFLCVPNLYLNGQSLEINEDNAIDNYSITKSLIHHGFYFIGRSS